MSGALAAAPGPATSLNDRFFALFPWAPRTVGFVLALALIAVITLASALAGDLLKFLEADEALWRTRDARIAFVLALLAAYLPTARRYASLELRERLPEIAAIVGQPVPPRPVRIGDGAFGVLLLPMIAIAIDFKPSLYLDPTYWRVETAWHWIVGSFVTWNAGQLAGTTMRESLRVSALAERIPEIDLLDLSGLRPFARLGQRFALLLVGIAAIFSMNVVEGALAYAIALILAITVAYALVCVVVPALGVNRRIRAEKERELGRVNAAIRGDAEALAHSPLADRRGELGLSDLLAYRETIAAVSEWPVDAPMRLRLLLYAAIPLASWFAGAVVEVLLDRVLG